MASRGREKRSAAKRKLRVLTDDRLMKCPALAFSPAVLLRPHIGYNHETLPLFVVACMLLWVLVGGLIVRGILSLLTKAKHPIGGGQLSAKSAEGARISQLARPDGSKLRVECYGREDATPIILTRLHPTDRCRGLVVVADVTHE